MPKQKEIIVFTDNMGNCGIQRVLSELTETWAGRGRRVTIVYNDRQHRDTEDFAWNPAIEMIGIPVGSGAAAIYPKLFRAYRKILRERPEAAAVSLSVMSNFVIGAVAPLVKNRIVISDRNDPRQRPAGKRKQRFRDKAFKQADALILQTDEVREYYEKRIGRTGTVIPNPISADISLIEPAEARRPAVVTASRLNRQKNLDMLIRAFGKFGEEFPEYTLEIFGRGEEEERLKALAAELGLSDRVVLKGFSSDLYHEIVDCGMYVCSSDYEGISNAVIEALGLGIPTISTDCPVGGARMLIEDGVNGLLVDVGDTDGLCAAMKKVAGSSALAKKLSENAVKVRERFRAERIAEQWLKVIDGE